MTAARVFAGVGGAGIALAAMLGAAGADGPKPAPIAWIKGYEPGLAEAKATGRPILLNFWCGT